MTVTKILNQAFEYLQDIPNDLYKLIGLVPALFGLYVVITEVYRYQQRIPGFKGPMGYPLFGNIPQVLGDSAEVYRKWAKIWGPVYQVQLGDIPVIVVNTANASKEIFLTNTRSTNSRPLMRTFHGVVSATQGATIGSSPMDESLKRRRKAATSALNKPAVQSYVHHIDLESKEFVSDCFIRGKAGKISLDPMPLIKRMSLNMSLTLNWGTRIDNIDDPLFREIIHVEEMVSSFRSTTSNWEDYVPILRLNPFSKITETALDTRKRRDVYIKKLNKELDDRMATKTHKPCIQANVLTDPEAKLNATELMSLSVTMINAGLDTVTSTVVWGIAMLATRPDIQEKAFNAIREFFDEDQVLCDPIEDQKCTYVVCFVRECLRYFTPLRLSLPRTVTTPFIYDGKKIPSGALIFHNTWACNMDPELYENPQEFRPERFLEHPQTPHFSYGYGSRMCAGNLLGNRELYLLFMRLISSFKIESPEEIDVNPLTGVHDPRALGVVPQPYKVVFKPRDEVRLAEALKSNIPVEI
jgi:3-hydroxyphenylacetate 6-hydroxylase